MYFSVSFFLVVQVLERVLETAAKSFRKTCGARSRAVSNWHATSRAPQLLRESPSQLFRNSSCNIYPRFRPAEVRWGGVGEQGNMKGT